MLTIANDVGTNYELIVNKAEKAKLCLIFFTPNSTKMVFNNRYVLFFLLAFSFFTPGKSQMELILQTTDTIICPGSTINVGFTVVGTAPPVFVTYLLDGTPTRYKTTNYNYGEIPINKPGFYPIIEYGNSVDTIRTSNHYISVEGSDLNAVLQGGGVFCGDDKVQPISVSLYGQSPWELSYIVDGINKTLVTSSSSYTLADYSGADVKLVEVKDQVCTRELSDSAFLGFYATPQVRFMGENTACAGSVSSFSVDYNELYAYYWKIPPTAQIVGGDTSSHIISLQWDTASTDYIRIRVSDTTTPCYGVNYNKLVRVYDVTHNQLSGDEKVCIGNSGSYATESIGSNYYKWKIPSAALPDRAIDTTTTAFNLEWQQPANDTVQLKVFSKAGNCESDWMKIPILVSRPPTFTIQGQPEACEGSNATFQTDYSPNYTYKWELPAIAGFRSGTDTNSFFLELAWNSEGEEQLGLSVTDTISGCTETKTFLVDIHPTPTTQSFDTAVCFGESSPLWVDTYSPPENTVFWVDLDRYGSVIQLEKSGFHRFVESTPYGCTATGSYQVTNTCSNNFYVPEIFSPNGDGVNDLLPIFGEFESCHIQIYTVSGELVYDGTQNTPPWDGTHYSQELPVGTYIWKAFVVDYEKNPYRREGTVTLIR